MGVTYYAVTDDPNELAHYGVPGMKWGVRRESPRHSGSRRPRSAAYKKAQGKLSMLMRHGIKRVQAHWKAYHSPKAKEERFMKKSMQRARDGTLRYGRLNDQQVKKVIDRLYLERQARQLGDTENTHFIRRLRTAIGEGIISGVGRGTSSYIDERFKGRGRTTAEINADKRKTRYESNRGVQRRKARNKVNQEYYEEAARRGARRGIIQTNRRRAQQLQTWNRENAENERERRNQETRDKAYYDTISRLGARHNHELETRGYNTGTSSNTTVTTRHYRRRRGRN